MRTKEFMFLLIGCKGTGRSSVLRGLMTSLRLDHDRRVTVALKKDERRITVNSYTVLVKSAPPSQCFFPCDADRPADNFEPYILFFAPPGKTEFAAQAVLNIAKHDHDVDEMSRLIHIAYPVKQPEKNVYIIPFQPTIEAKINIVADIINKCIKLDLFLEH